MIGNYVRGPRHLIRSVEENKSLNLLLIKNSRINFCESLMCKNSDGQNIYVFFQNIGGCRKYEGLIDNKFYNIFNEKLSKYNFFIILKNKDNKDDLLTISSIYNRCIILPNEFDDMYSKFCKSNKKLFTPIFSYLDYDCIGQYLFSLIGNKPNLFLWAITNLYKRNVSLIMLEHIIKWNDNYSKQVSKLSKGTITAYNTRKNIDSLYNELMEIRANKRANDSINMFNTIQKKALKSFTLNDRQIDILNKFGRLSLKKRINFIRKMSTIDSPDEILKQMLYLTNSQFEWDKNSLVDYINNADNIDSEIIINNGNILLVKVNNYDTIKFLARTTNWCISKNKRYWDDYVGKRGKNISQYVLFDFSQNEDDNLSIIGFTIDNRKGITNAHDFTNENLMINEENIDGVNVFFPKIKENIYSILKFNNIDLNFLIKTEPCRYEWNRDSFMDFLFHCINENNVNVLVDTNEKVVISTKDCNINHVIGYGYEKVFGRDINSHKIFIFADFTKPIQDNRRMIWCIISLDNGNYQESCNQIFDASGNIIYGLCFDRLLDENHLPYDTICRVYKEDNLLTDAFMLYDINRINSILKKGVSASSIKNNKNNKIIPHLIENTICSYKTFDFLNAIYDNGYKICDFTNYTNVFYLIKNLIEYSYNGRDGITENDIELFNNGELKNRNKIISIEFLIGVKNILSKETDSCLFKHIIENIYTLLNDKTFIEDFIINKVTENFIKLINDGVKFYYKDFINFLASNQYNKYSELILNNCKNNIEIKKQIENCNLIKEKEKESFKFEDLIFV